MRWRGGARNSNSNHELPNRTYLEGSISKVCLSPSGSEFGHLSSCPAPRQSQLLPALSPRLPCLFWARPLPPPPPRDGSTQTTYSRVRPTVTHQHTLMIHPSLESRNKTRVFLPSSKGRCCWFSGWTFRFPTTVLTRGSTSARLTVSLAPFGTDDRADSRTALKTYSRQQPGRGQTASRGICVAPSPGPQPHGPCTPA